jgi:DNA-binding SARP family transcriptional activator
MTGVSDDLRFALLGPLEVSRGDSPVPLPAARHRAVLALLLLSANRYVARDVLIDRVWNGTPPDAAVKTLQSYLSRLRGLLGGRSSGLIESGHGGRTYRLVVEPAAVDALHCEELVTRGRTALADGDVEVAATSFDEAVALWRGRPLADLADEYRFAEQVGHGLATLRATAVEGAFEAAAALNLLAERVDEIQREVRRYPDRTVLRHLLLRGLCEAGRQADALTAYREYRLSRREQGLDPEPTIEELHRRILRQQTPATPSTVGTSGLFGRAGVLRRLDDMLVAARSGRGTCVLLSGEAGIGKTALVSRLADAAAAQGVRTVCGSPHDPTGPAAFRSWLQVLDALATTGVGASDRGDITAARGLLVGEDPWSATDDRAVDPTDVRGNRFAAVSTALRAAATTHPLLIVLDDVHLAGPACMALLTHVARLVHGSRILLVAVAREPVDDLADSDWTHHAEQLRRLPGVRTLRLGPLDDEALRQLVTDELGRTPGSDLLAAVAERARGNPLFAVELTRLLADGSALGGLCDTGSLAKVPPLVRDVMLRRVDRLPDACRELLSFAAVLGVEFEAGLLDTGTSIDPGILATVIHERLVEEAGTDTLRFRHPLMRDALYEDLVPEERAALHARAIAAIETRYVDRLDEQAQRLAHHWKRTGGAAARVRAAEFTVRAARHAAAVCAWDESARLLQAAVELDDRNDDGYTVRLLVELGRMLVAAGDAVRGGQRFVDALALAPAGRAPALFVRVVQTIAETGTFLVTGPSADHTARLLAEAVEVAGGSDPALRARLLAGLSDAMVWATGGSTTDDRRRRDALTHEAVELARRHGDRSVLLRALCARVTAIDGPDDPGERLRLCTDVVALTRHGDDPDRALIGHHGRFVAALELGQPAVARAEADACALIAGTSHRADHRFWAAVLDGTWAMMTGQFSAAEAAIARNVVTHRIDDDRYLGGQHGGITAQMLLFHREQGRLPGQSGPDAATVGDSLLSRPHRHAPLWQLWQVGTASFLLASGHAGQAREMYDYACATGFAPTPDGASWPATMAVAADLSVAFADMDTAGRLYTALAPYAAQCAVITCGYGCLGSVAHVLGQLAGCLGRWKEADDHFQSATDANRRLGAPPLVARTQLEHARMLLRSGDRRLIDRAHALLTAAAVTATRLGMAPMLAASRTLLAESGPDSQ